MSDFKFNVRKGETGGCFICEITGTLDITTMVGLETMSRQVSKQGNERLIIDFSQLEYVNSQGLGALLSLQKALDPGGGGMVIVSLQERCKKIFDITGLNRAIPVYKDIAEALRQDPLFKVG